jgi:serine/threonine protein kinase
MYAPLDCPEIESWQALFDGILPPDQRERYERHLESCSFCQARLDQGEERGAALVDLVRQVGDPTLLPPDPGLSQFLERLHWLKSPFHTEPAEPADLYFLRPADRPGLLGKLGDYDVQEVIGQGGFGIVLKAYEQALQRPVAIKVLSPALAGSATARKRFTREAQAAAAVCHDHIVAVHGVHETDGLPYLVMQYVAGESLQARLDRTGTLDVVETVRIGLQTAQGLAAAHKQGLIHRDIKPANLLLENGLARVKITDFGLARMADDVGLTQNGVVAGTPEYMSPEQARAEAVDHRADLFSLGSVLYACCTGRPPFRGSSAIGVLRQVSDQEPPAIRSLNPEAPAWLEAFIARLMTKNPQERFQSAAEAAGLLEGYLAHLCQPVTVAAPELPLSSPASFLGRSAARLRRLGLLLVLLAMAVGLTAFLLFQEPPNQQPASLGSTFYRDFRNRRSPDVSFRLIGPNVEHAIQPEDAGLRITLLANRGNTERAGLELKAPIKGNFEITVGYEILEAEQPKTGYGVGIELFVLTGGFLGEGLGVYRVVRVQQGEVYMLSRNTTENGERKYRQKYIPTAARSGQLRITRKGTEATLWAAEGNTGDFQELGRYDLGPEDVQGVWLTAFTGHAPYRVDLRLVDLKIRSDIPISELPPDTPASSDEAPKARGREWLTAALLFGLGVTLALLLVAWFWARRGRNGEAVAPGISFPCPECRKKLRARAELAGKEVKCPQCGQRVAVPDPRPSDTRFSSP